MDLLVILSSEVYTFLFNCSIINSGLFSSELLHPFIKSGTTCAFPLKHSVLPRVLPKVTTDLHFPCVEREKKYSLQVV